MSKKDKLLTKLFAKPSPKDFSWSEIITLTGHFGFKNTCKGGSHYTFEHQSGFRFSMSKTHPGGILKSYQVCAAKEAINYIKDETSNE